jgi:hypothetical protein
MSDGDMRRNTSKHATNKAWSEQLEMAELILVRSVSRVAPIEVLDGEDDGAGVV